MVRRTHIGTLRLIALAAGAILVWLVVMWTMGVRSGGGAPTVLAWAGPLAFVALLALVAFLMSERAGEKPVGFPGSTACASCGKPIIEEWRLCPHCGELLECDLSLPVEGENRG